MVPPYKVLTPPQTGGLAKYEAVIKLSFLHWIVLYLRMGVCPREGCVCACVCARIHTHTHTHLQSQSYTMNTQKKAGAGPQLPQEGALE